VLVFGREGIVHGWSRLRGQSVSDAVNDAEDDSGNGDQPPG